MIRLFTLVLAFAFAGSLNASSRSADVALHQELLWLETIEASLSLSEDQHKALTTRSLKTSEDRRHLAQEALNSLRALHLLAEDQESLRVGPVSHHWKRFSDRAVHWKSSAVAEILALSLALEPAQRVRILHKKLRHLPSDSVLPPSYLFAAQASWRNLRLHHGFLEPIVLETYKVQKHLLADLRDDLQDLRSRTLLLLPDAPPKKRGLVLDAWRNWFGRLEIAVRAFVTGVTNRLSAPEFASLGSALYDLVKRLQAIRDVQSDWKEGLNRQAELVLQADQVVRTGIP